MRFRVEVVCVAEDGAEERRAVTELERRELAMETLGLTLADGKTILAGVQEIVTGEHVAEALERHRACEKCGKRRTSKEGGTAEVETCFGPVEVPNPRWKRCSCTTDGPKTVRPVASWLPGRCSPERLYLETKWGSRIPFEKVTHLLQEVLPVGEVNRESVRAHLYATASRIERELGEERPSLVDGTDVEWEELPIPDGPMTVGIDGGYVRAAHKQGFFEVIAGKSVVTFRRDGGDVPPAKRFGFVQTYDDKPRRRLWEVMKSQGMQENQAVTFLSDGGEDVRQVQQYLHPQGEHIVDWFHITMRMTVLGQQAKTLAAERPDEGAAASKAIGSTKHLLWHGNVPEALERISDLMMTLHWIRAASPAARKLHQSLMEFEVYIRNNKDFIPNYGERHRQGEAISTAFVESTINQVVSRRFVKKQQMHWTQRGAHLLLQTRTKVLNEELDEVFRRWYPRFREAA